jgi:hypothetical protein
MSTKLGCYIHDLLRCGPKRAVSKALAGDVVQNRVFLGATQISINPPLEFKYPNISVISFSPPPLTVRRPRSLLERSIADRTPAIMPHKTNWGSGQIDWVTSREIFEEWVAEREAQHQAGIPQATAAERAVNVSVAWEEKTKRKWKLTFPLK